MITTQLETLETPDPLALSTLSRVIGTMTGYRAYTRPMQAVLASLGCLELRINGEVFAAPFPQLRLRTVNVADGRLVFARLASRGLTRQQIDEMWRDALVDDGIQAALPCEIVGEFIHRDVWPMVRQIVEWGPVETVDRFRRHLRNEARRELDPRRGGDVGLCERSLAVHITALGMLFKHLHELAIAEFDRSLVAHRWDRALPKLPKESEFGARKTTGNLNAAPDDFDARRALAHIDSEVKKRWSHASTRPFILRLIRNRAFVGVLAATGVRKGSMIADAVVANYLACGEVRRDTPGLVGPALFMTIEKRRTGSSIQRWKPLPDEVGAWIEEYLDYANLTDLPEAPLWITGWADRRGRVPNTTRPLSYHNIGAIVRGFWNAAGQPLRPPHAFRHLVEELANEAGFDYLAENPESRKSMSTQVFADGLLDHAMTGDALGYKGLNNEPGRMKLAGLASKGLWEHLRGERGARKGIDRERLIMAKREVEEATARVSAVGRQIEEHRRQRRAKVDRAHNARENGGRLTAEEATDLILDLGLLASLLDDEQDELVTLREQLHDARAELHAARTDLIPLPDDAPETDPDDPELANAIADDLQSTKEPRPFVRDWTTFKEGAKAFGVSEVTMRRWANGQLPYAEGDPRNPWDAQSPPIQVLSERKRRLIVTELDPKRVSPTILAALNDMRREMPT